MWCQGKELSISLCSQVIKKRFFILKLPHTVWRSPPALPTHLPLYSSGKSWEEDCIFSLGFNWLNAFSVQMLPRFWEDAHVQEIQLLPLWGWEQTHLHCQCQTFSVRNNQPLLFNNFALHTRHFNYVWHVKHFYQYHLKHNIKFQALRHLREIITVYCVLTRWATSMQVRGGAWKQGEWGCEAAFVMKNFTSGKRVLHF